MAPPPLCWCGRPGAESPPHAGRRLRGPRAPPGTPVRGCPASLLRPHGDSRVLPSRHGAGWPAALGSALSLALQRRGGGGGGWGPPLAGTTLPCQPGVPELPTRLGPSPQGWATRPSASSRRRAGKEGHRPGKARVRPRGAGLGEAAEPQWPGGGALARCPCPAACHPAPPPRPGRRRAVTPAAWVPGRPTSRPPARPPARRLAWVTLRKEFIVRN